MSEDWTKVTLGDIVTMTKGSTATQKAIPGKYPLVVTAADFLSSDHYQFEGEAVCVPMVSSTGHGHASLKRVHYASGKFAVANIITALQKRNDAPVDMKYLHLLLDHQRDSIIVPLMKGTANVSLSQRSLAGAIVSLPPVKEQHRIVDLIGAVDDVIQASLAIRTAAEGRLEQLSYDSIQPLGTGSTPLANFLSRSIGGVWGMPEGDGEVDVVAFRSTEFSDWGAVIHKDPAIRSVTARVFVSRALKPGDILVEKSGGTPTRPVGRVVQFHEHDLKNKSIGTNFMQIVSPDESVVDPRYVFWLLWTSHRRGGTVVHQNASTNIRNLQTKAYLQQAVDLPPRDEQNATAALLDAALRVRTAADQQVERLRELRSNLLTALLSGEHEIPESYDELLEVHA